MLQDLGKFSFVASNIFSARGWHAASGAELLRLIERLEELHTKLKGTTTPPQLSTTLLFDVSRGYLEGVGDPRATVLFLL